MEIARYEWRVPVKIPVVKLIGAVLFAGLGVLVAGEWWQLAAVVSVALGLVVWGVRDLLVPVRLAADPTGLTVVVGYAGRRRLAWSEIERVRVDERRRSRMLEVDTGETLHLLSRYDVDADLDEIADRLVRLRTG